MATDDSDSRPTTSKFPKTRPAELNSKQGENGQEIDLVANYIKILAAPKCKFSMISSFIQDYFYHFRGFISIPLFI
jgi:hypothetical protein